jgi:hypothetical protein
METEWAWRGDPGGLKISCPWRWTSCLLISVICRMEQSSGDLRVLLEDVDRVVHAVYPSSTRSRRSVCWRNAFKPSFPGVLISRTEQLRVPPGTDRGTRWCGWLRHCATSRKVAGSIQNGVIGIFHWDPFGRTMALGSTQPLTEMSKGGRCVGLTTLPPSCADCLEIWEFSTSWNAKGLSRPVMGLLYLVLILLITYASYFLV